MNDNRTYRDYYMEAMRIEDTDLDAAIAIVTEGIQANLDDDLDTVTLYAARSVYYEFKRNYDAAIEDRSKVIAMASKHLDEDREIEHDYAYRAHLWRQKGDFQKAVEDYTAAIVIDPENYRYYLKRGMNQLSLEHRDAALDDFRRAFQLIDHKGVEFHWLEEYLAEHDKAE